MNVTNHQGKANRNHSARSSHICQDGYFIKKTKKQKQTKAASVGEEVEKLESFYTGWKCKMVKLLWKTI